MISKRYGVVDTTWKSLVEHISSLYSINLSQNEIEKENEALVKETIEEWVESTPVVWEGGSLKETIEASGFTSP